jgi:tetratricopeptide (TPR) repeat protein
MTIRRYDEHGLPIPPTFDDDAPTTATSLTARRRRAVRALLALFAVGALGVVLLQTSLRERANKLISSWLLNRAMEKYLADDLPGALAELDRAVAWSPDSPDVFALRADVRLAANDLPGSLADCNKLIGLAPKFAPAYVRRGYVYQRLERHREAIDDATRSIELSSIWNAAEALNGRAYIRALAGMELEQGLEDVEKALRLHENEPAYLDTRGYLRYLLGRYQPALADMDLAIDLSETRKANHLRMIERRRVPPQAVGLLLRHTKENLAVMYHHRGQIHEKLGNSGKAQADLRLGDELGYNPATGVY